MCCWPLDACRQLSQRRPMALPLLPLLLATVGAASGSDSVFDVTHYGARPCAPGGGACPSCTAAFRAATAAAAKAALASPGQRAEVLVPGPATYTTGPFNVSTRTTLLVQPGAVVKGSENLSEYTIIAPLPSYGSARDGRPPGCPKDGCHTRYQALVMVPPGSVDVILAGGGTLDGSGSFWWSKGGQLKAGRPHLVELQSATRVEVGPLTLLNSGFWTLHPVYSKDIHIHDLNISAPAPSPNTDGIDPDSSENVLIERCTISCGDDRAYRNHNQITSDIAIKSGLDAFGLAVAKPSRNITVRGNVHLAGRGISIGSEVSGGIETVRIEDVSHLGPSEHGLHIKTSPTRGAYIRDVAYDNITVGNVQHDYVISLTTSYGSSKGKHPKSALTEIAGVRYSNIRRGGATIHDTGAGEWECFAERPCVNFSMVEVDIAPAQKWKCSNLDKASTHAVAVQPSQGLGECFREEEGLAVATQSGREGRVVVPP